MLARRLINQQSISIDAEEFMVTKLKVIHHENFLLKIDIFCFIKANMRL